MRRRTRRYEARLVPWGDSAHRFILDAGERFSCGDLFTGCCEQMSTPTRSACRRLATSPGSTPHSSFILHAVIRRRCSASPTLVGCALLTGSVQRDHGIDRRSDVPCFGGQTISMTSSTHSCYLTAARARMLLVFAGIVRSAKKSKIHGKKFVSFRMACFSFV
jgi:hypothetical protein